MVGISKDPVGLTQNSGWQVGVRRTIPVPAKTLWDLMMSERGIRIWLGIGSELKFSEGEQYTLADGTTGVIRVYKPGSHWRISRQPDDPAYTRPSLMQIRIQETGGKSTLAFHEEHLPLESERQKRKTFYLEVVEKIKHELTIR